MRDLDALARMAGEFLELVLADEVTRRDSASAALPAKTAGLDPSMRLELWDDSAAITCDYAMWDELCSLRFVEAAHNVVIRGPVGVGSARPSWRPHSAISRSGAATACTSNAPTACSSALKASRLDNSHDAEVRKLLRVDVLLLDLASKPSMLPIPLRSMRSSWNPPPGGDGGDVEPGARGWLGLMADALLAQSGIDRLQSAAHKLVLDGQSYRHRQKPAVADPKDDHKSPTQRRPA